MSTELKNTLFSFSTLRVPALLSESDKAIGFIFHPELDSTREVLKATATTFFKQEMNAPKATSSLQFVVVKAKALTYATATLLTRKSGADISGSLERYIGTPFWNFSNTLSKTKSSTLESKIAVPSPAAGVTALSDAQKVVLWDNLFVQVVTQRDPALRDAIIHVLIANHYLVNPGLATQDKTVKASIVIPPSFFATSALVAMESKKFDINSSISTDEFRNMTKALIVSDQKEIITSLIGLKTQLGNLETAFRNSQSRTLNEYQESFKRDLAEAYKKSNIKETNYENKITGEVVIRQEYENLTLPEFNYVPQTENEGFLDNFLADENVSKFLAQNEAENITSSVQLYELLEKNIIEANTIISKNTPSSKKNTAVIAGIRINTNSSELNRTGTDFPFLISITHHAADLALPYNPSIPHPWKDIKLVITNLTYLDVSHGQSTFKFILPDNTVKDFALPTETETTLPNVTFAGFDNTHPIMLHDYQDEESITFKGNVVLTDGILQLTASIPIGFSNRSDTTKTANGKAVFIPSATPVTPVDTAFIPSRFGIRNLGIADYRKVEQEICCYRAGEVSHIENIMAREYREKATERSRVVDTTTTNTSEREAESLTDTTTATRTEMHTEVAQVLHEDTQIGLNAEVHYGTKNFGASINGSFAHNTSEDDSTTQAITYAQDVTERAMARVVARTKSEIVTKIVESYKESNKHGFDNTQGTQHVSGVYRWVNKVYNNQLVNYGKRAMVEFMIPEPARFHILASDKDHNTDNVNKIPEPIDPRTSDAGNNKIETYANINSVSNPENYIYWASQFGIEVDDYPATTISVGKSFTKSEAEGDGGKFSNKAASEDVDIPAGYYLDTAYVRYSFVNGGGGLITVLVADVSIANGGFNTWDGSDPKYTSKVPVSVLMDKAWVANVNVNLILKRTPELFQSWQNKVFNNIIEAYEKRLSEFNDAEAAVKQVAAEKNTYNSMYYRQIERNALKKNMMHYLVDEKFIGQNHLIAQTSITDLRPNNNQAFDDNASVTKFMEQAFEWEIISYTFYPYYWGAKTRWKANYNYQFDDALFTNFMQAGMARVILTIRPGFEKAVNWYMATGQVWNGGQVPTIGDELFLSIDEELKDTTPVPEGLPWKTVLPSDLTVIQSSTIGLLAEGLPCGCPTTVGGEVDFDSQIKSTNTQLGGDKVDPIKEKLVVKDGFLQLITDDEKPSVIAQIAMDEIKKNLGL